MKEEDKKEGLLKRLKNIEKNQNSNNNDKSKKTNDKSNLSSARSESSFYFNPPGNAKSKSVSDDELERSVYLPDVANIKGINILEPKNETQTSFEYLKNNTKESFWAIQIFLIQI